jgi:hypothetical protein
MQIVTATSDIIFDKPDVVDWRNEEVVLWVGRIGLEKYVQNFTDQKIDGIHFIKCNAYDFKTKFKVNDTKDLKLLLKSIDFLRIFIKLRKDCQDFIDIEKINDEEANKLEGKGTTEQLLALPLPGEDNKDEKAEENASVSPSKKTKTKFSKLPDTNDKANNNDDASDINHTEQNLNNSLINNNPGFYITKLSISNNSI